jgi:hypothetical protein
MLGAEHNYCKGKLSFDNNRLYEFPEDGRGRLKHVGSEKMKIVVFDGFNRLRPFGETRRYGQSGNMVKFKNLPTFHQQFVTFGTRSVRLVILEHSADGVWRKVWQTEVNKPRNNNI